MVFFGIFTKQIGEKDKSHACPKCHTKLKDFGINVDNSSIMCPNCHNEFDPQTVLHDSDILSLAKYCLPPEKCEQFLLNLGFERKSISRTPKVAVVGLISFWILAGVVGAVFVSYNVWWKRILPFLAVGLMIGQTINIYNEEKKPLWRRKENTSSKKLI